MAVRYARDAGPRPRLRGTHASNPEHRGLLSQPVVRKHYQYRMCLEPAIENGLPEMPEPALMLLPALMVEPAYFLGSGESVWGRRTEDSTLVRPRWPRGKGEPVHILSFRIQERVGQKKDGRTARVLPSRRARVDWSRKEVALWEMLRERAERDQRKGTQKPVSRRRGPDGKPKPVQDFPHIPSPLSVELSIESLEGRDEEDTM